MGLRQSKLISEDAVSTSFDNYSLCCAPFHNPEMGIPSKFSSFENMSTWCDVMLLSKTYVPSTPINTQFLYTVAGSLSSQLKVKNTGSYEHMHPKSSLKEARLKGGEGNDSQRTAKRTTNFPLKAASHPEVHDVLTSEFLPTGQSSDVCDIALYRCSC
jgi:hypothetical protein